jgi:hypothetical protein
VIGCVSPASLDFDKTFNTLSFLTQVQGISNTPVVNGGTDSIDHEFNADAASEEQCTDVVDSEERSTNTDTFGYVSLLLI